MQTSRVLIVDDDPILLDTVSSTLRLKLPDVQIDTLDSTLASLKRIRSIEYAAIICDGHQPRMEGVAFVRAVRKLQPEWPVLLLIEKHDQDLIAQGIDAGAYDVLVKPFDEGLLLLAVHRALEASRLRCQIKREEEKLLITVGTLMRDLEGLYGAYGLHSHFEAFMALVKTLENGVRVARVKTMRARSHPGEMHGESETT